MFELNPVIPATSEKERLPAEQLLSQQIADHQAQNSKRSLLASALGTVYSNGDGTLSELEALQHSRKRAALGQDIKTLSQIDSQIRGAVKEDTGALETRQHLDHLATGLFKTATLFLPAAGKTGWAARAATAVVFGLDNAHSGDSTGQQLLDGGLGATKGLALRGILGASGRLNNPFIQGTMVGASSRGMDVLLSTNSYVGMDGEVNVGKGLTTAFSSAFDKRALAVDGMLFTAAAGLGLGAQALGPDKLFRTPLAHTVTTSASFGFTTGAYTEMSRQTAAGEELDLGKVVKWGLTQSAVDGIAGIPGGLMRNRMLSTSAPGSERLESHRPGREADLLKPGNERGLRDPLPGEPLNVYSRGPEALGRFWSNFSHTPFTVDGTRFASVEGFYVALKTADPALQAKAASLSGFEAKQFGRELPKSDVGFYQGKTFKMGSPEHHGLVEKALRAKAEHYPQMAQALADTFPRPIVHDVGRPEGRTNYPAAVFAKTLESLRGDIIAARGESAKPMEQPGRTTGDTALTPKPVSELLRGITDPDALRVHDIHHYAKAFENSPFQAKRVMAVGGDTVTMELANGNVLKMTNTRRFVDNMGERPFDLPILERGVMPNPLKGRDIQYFIQPMAQTPVSAAEMTKFFTTARENGYRFTDPKASNLGTYQGKTYLLDPWAAEY